MIQKLVLDEHTVVVVVGAAVVVVVVEHGDDAWDDNLDDVEEVVVDVEAAAVVVVVVGEQPEVEIGVELIPLSYYDDVVEHIQSYEVQQVLLG